MSYEIFIEPSHTRVRLHGDVRAADLLRSHEEKQFLDAIDLIPVIIYDYSDADNILIDEKGAILLAQLADHIAKLHSPIHIIIVPHNPNDLTRPELYKASVESPNVTVDIVKNTNESITMAKKISSP